MRYKGIKDAEAKKVEAEKKKTEAIKARDGAAKKGAAKKDTGKNDAGKRRLVETCQNERLSLSNVQPRIQTRRMLRRIKSYQAMRHALGQTTKRGQLSTKRTQQRPEKMQRMQQRLGKQQAQKMRMMPKIPRRM